MNKRSRLKAIKERSLLDKEKEEILGKLQILRLICLSVFFYFAVTSIAITLLRAISLRNREKFLRWKAFTKIRSGREITDDVNFTYFDQNSSQDTPELDKADDFRVSMFWPQRRIFN